MAVVDTVATGGLTVVQVVKSLMANKKELPELGGLQLQENTLRRLIFKMITEEYLVEVISGTEDYVFGRLRVGPRCGEV